MNEYIWTDYLIPGENELGRILKINPAVEKSRFRNLWDDGG
jgi:hypothetical protein